MTLFVYLAGPREIQEAVYRVFNKQALKEDATDFPIGIAARGGHNSWVARILYLDLTVEWVEYEEWLRGRREAERRREDNDARLFISGIEALLATHGCMSVSFIAHWTRKRFSEEQIHLRGKKLIELAALDEAISVVKEDVLYTVRRHVDWSVSAWQRE